MEPADFVEPEIAVTAAITAAICSPRARKVMRKGLVYGMAGVLTAGDVVTAFARSMRQGAEQAEEKKGAAPGAAVAERQPEEAAERQPEEAKMEAPGPEKAEPTPRKATKKKATGGKSV